VVKLMNAREKKKQQTDSRRVREGQGRRRTDIYICLEKEKEE
jgi:hypothetical protein